MQVGGGEHAGAAPFHLLEINTAADIAEEDEDFERLDVRAGGDHVHGDGDAQRGREAELPDEFLGFRGLAGDGMLRLIGDLFAEVVPLPKDLAAEVDDVLGVGVVLGEDERLWHERAAGEQLGLHDIAIGAQDGANLIGHDDGAVEVGGRVIEIVGEDGLPGLARGFAAVVDEETLVHFPARVGDPRFDAIHVVADIHAIGDGALVVVFGDAVLVEVGDGLRRGRGGEADERGVEVFEHLPPEIVDGAMALVGDDVIEHLDGDGWIVGDVARARAECGGDFGAGEIVRSFREILAAQDRVEPLDGADGDAADVVDVGRGEVLDVVEFREETASVGRAVAVKFVAGLFAEVCAIHEEEDAARLGVFDQAIGDGAGGESFSRAGRHVDKGARTIFGEGFFEAGDGFDLAVAHPIRGERVRERHRLQPGTQRVRLRGPFDERLGAMEGEDAAGARRGIAFVAEESFRAGGLVEERERACESGSEEIRETRRVPARLLGDGRERGAFLLRLDDTERMAIHEQQVIAGAGLQRNFTQRDAAAGGKIHRLEILNDPAGRDEHRINLLTGFFFRGHVPGCRPRHRDDSGKGMKGQIPILNGAAVRSRTSNLLIRSQMLYPIELRLHSRFGTRRKAHACACGNFFCGPHCSTLALRKKTRRPFVSEHLPCMDQTVESAPVFPGQCLHERTFPETIPTKPLAGGFHCAQFQDAHPQGVR